MLSAFDAGEKRHPQLVMKQLSELKGFSILGGFVVGFADCWMFKIDREIKKNEIPSYIDVIEETPYLLSLFNPSDKGRDGVEL